MLASVFPHPRPMGIHAQWLQGMHAGELTASVTLANAATVNDEEYRIEIRGRPKQRFMT